MAFEGLVLSHGLELSIHAREVPDLQQVVKATGDHAVAMTVNIDRLQSLVVAFEDYFMTDRKRAYLLFLHILHAACDPAIFPGSRQPIKLLLHSLFIVSHKEA